MNKRITNNIYFAKTLFGWCSFCFVVGFFYFVYKKYFVIEKINSSPPIVADSLVKKNKISKLERKIFDEKITTSKFLKNQTLYTVCGVWVRCKSGTSGEANC